MAANIRRTPEQIFGLIMATKMPEGLPTTAVTPAVFSAWEDRMQDYYDRLADLRCQLHAAIPPGTPTWVSSSAYRAWLGAVKEAERWAWEVKRRQQRNARPAHHIR